MDPPRLEAQHISLPPGVRYVAAMVPERQCSIQVYVALPRSKSFVPTTLTLFQKAAGPSKLDRKRFRDLEDTIRPLNTAHASKGDPEPLRALLSTLLLPSVEPTASIKEVSDMIRSRVAKAYAGDFAISLQAPGPRPRVRLGSL